MKGETLRMAADRAMSAACDLLLNIIKSLPKAIRDTSMIYECDMSYRAQKAASDAAITKEVLLWHQGIVPVEYLPALPPVTQNQKNS